jgi:hypothetical protein
MVADPGRDPHALVLASTTAGQIRFVLESLSRWNDHGEPTNG